jgi:hypothetical protein
VRLRGLLPALAVVAGLVGGAAGTFRDSVVDGREFADRVAAALSTPEARRVVGEQVAAQIVAQVPEALAVRPLIETAVQGALGTDAFRDILAAAIRDLHGTLLTGRTDTVSLRLVDLVLVAKTQLAAVSPELAALIPDDLTDALVAVSAGAWDVDTVRAFDRVRLAAFLGPLLALLLLGAVVAASRDRRRGLVAAAAVLPATGLALVAAEQVGRAVALHRFDDPDARTVAAAIWDGLTADVLPLALGLTAVGAGLATLTVLVGQGLRPAELLARATGLVRVPDGRRARAVWSAGAAGTGLLLLAYGPQVARFALTAAGAALLLTGLSEAVRLLAPTRARAAAAPEPDAGTARGGAPRTRATRTGEARADDARGGATRAGGAGRPQRPVVALGGLVGVLVLAGGAVAIDRSGGGRADDRTDPRCNGSVLLCDRPFDQVALAATHNSMAAADEGFLQGNQPHGIIAQLDAGYRGLLIDTYYGLSSPTSSVVVTDRAPLTAAQRAAQVADVGEASVRAAEEVRRRATTTGGTRGTYLCHASCEIGATPLEPELTGVREWLDAHPREVIVVFVQDGTTPQDTVDAFRAAGLDRYAYAHPPGAAWPTLREMIEGGTRLLVMAENRAGAADWYQDGFTLTQETPYSFRDVGDFSCRPNRGRPGSPLFLVNHFVTPASVTAAARANSAPVLTARLRACQRERRHIPNLVAVDFYDRGAVLAAVDALNGVG